MAEESLKVVRPVLQDLHATLEDAGAERVRSVGERNVNAGMRVAGFDQAVASAAFKTASIP